jgi:hypothetical protein
MDPMTMMLVSAGVQAGTAAYRNIKAQRGLAELDKQALPKYMDAASPILENKRMYEQMARTGMGPASLNLARNTFAAGQNALGAAPAGGQLRTQIGRLAGANAGAFANQLAGQNEGIRRQAMGGVAQANLGLSGLQQRDIGVGLQRRSEAERGYGQAIQDSRREMTGALGGLLTGYLGYKNAEANRDMWRDIYGKPKTSTTTPPAPSNTGFSPVNTPNTFYSKPAGPPTFDEYLKAGTPAGTTTMQYNSYSPDFSVPTPPIDTPFRAPDPNAMRQFTTPAMLENLPSGAGLKPTPIPTPTLPSYPITNTGTISVPNNMSQRVNFGDMSGDPFYNQVYNPNALRFSNPYNMNRGFMDQYDAVPGPYGQIMFKPN